VTFGTATLIAIPGVQVLVVQAARDHARLLEATLAIDSAREERVPHVTSAAGIRHLMCEAADQAGKDPGRLSFMRSLRVIRRQVTAQAGFSPCRLSNALGGLSETLQRKLSRTPI